MNSTVKKRSIAIGGHKTSVSLEDYFWTSLKQIARERTTTVSELVEVLDAARAVGNLSSTIRVFVLDHYRNNVATLALTGREVSAAPLTQTLKGGFA
jgi:predicted DNA-binding ribbon-helix-helix protein